MKKFLWLLLLSAFSLAAYAGDTSIKGKVTLDPKIAAKASPTDTVFVFARAKSGPRMPLAIVKRQAKDLPFEFTLDDSNAMIPDMRLSDFQEVEIVARVSKSGSAKSKSGDLEGKTGTIKPGSRNAAIVINAVVP